MRKNVMEHVIRNFSWRAKNLPFLFCIVGLLQVSVCWSQETHSSTSPGSPEIVEQPRDQLVTPGQPVTLNCKASGRPSPRVHWLKNGRRLDVDEDGSGGGVVQRYFLHDGALYFVEVKPQLPDSRTGDAGVYQCVAVNSRGETRSRNATLAIAYLRDQFQVSPQDVTVAQSKRVHLRCQPPDGHPKPEISWRRDGQPLSVTSSRRWQVLASSGDLVINDVRHHDQGMYTCVARNMAATRISTPARLTVNVRPFFITPPRANVEATAGRRVELTCHVSGDPMPAVTWRRVSGTLPVGRVHVTADKKSLRIDLVRLEDQGQYQCHAENPVGHVTALTTLSVTAPPQITSRSLIAESDVAAPVSLHCDVRGRPTPLVYWLREGTTSPVAPADSSGGGGLSLASNGSLLLPRPLPGDQGYYMCGAVSSVGADLLSLELLLRSQPAAQLGPRLRRQRRLLADLPACRLTARPLSSTSVQLVWTAVVADLNSAGGEAGFRVRYRSVDPTTTPDSRVAWSTVTLDERAQSLHRLENLEPASNYQVFVSPFLSDTEGRACSLATFTTPEDVPSSAPTSVRVQVINGTNALLHWTSPVLSQRRGRLIGYRLLLWTNATHLRRDYQLNDTTAGRLLTELAPNTGYWLSLAARTSAGAGPLSTAVAFVTGPSLDVIIRRQDGGNGDGDTGVSLMEQPWFVALLSFLALVAAAVVTAIWLRRHHALAGSQQPLTLTKCVPPPATSSLIHHTPPPAGLWLDRGWSAADCGGVQDALAERKLLVSTATTMGGSPCDGRAGEATDRAPIAEYAELEENGPYASTCVITTNPLSAAVVRPGSLKLNSSLSSGSGGMPDRQHYRPERVDNSSGAGGSAGGFMSMPGRGGPAWMEEMLPPPPPAPQPTVDAHQRRVSYDGRTTGSCSSSYDTSGGSSCGGGGGYLPQQRANCRSSFEHLSGRHGHSFAPGKVPLQQHHHAPPHHHHSHHPHHQHQHPARPASPPTPSMDEYYGVPMSASGATSGAHRGAHFVMTSRKDALLHPNVSLSSSSAESHMPGERFA